MNNQKTQEQIDDEMYPEKDYQKKIFQFSKEELADLTPFDEATRIAQAMALMGGIAQNAKDKYVASQVLGRLGVKRSEDTRFSYDLTNNRIVFYEPKFWCSMCNEKKAEFKYKDKIFCNQCIEKVKEEIGKPMDNPVETKVEKKAEEKEVTQTNKKKK